MNDARVGAWSLAPNTPDTLQYDPHWVASEQGRPLSLSLPFLPGNAPQRGEKVRTYFENLLPDSKPIRERLARRFRAGSTDAFELLAEIGRDCVGALEILPEDQPSAGMAALQSEPLSEVSPHRARMAMAVRTKNAHWRMRDIMRRHWVTLGARHGIVTEDGRQVESLIDEIVAGTPAVIKAVRTQLPEGFPATVADSILEGLQTAASRLAGQG